MSRSHVHNDVVGDAIHCVSLRAGSENANGVTDGVTLNADGVVTPNLTTTNLTTKDFTTITSDIYSLHVGELAYPRINAASGTVITNDGGGVLTLQPLPLFPLFLAQMTVNQSTNVGSGDHVKFDTVLRNPSTTSSLVSLDTTTPYTTASNVASIGRLTLQGGHTYHLRMVVDTSNFNNATSSLTMQLFNSDGNVALGQAQTVARAVGSSSNSALMCTTTVTVATPTRFEMRLSSVVALQSISAATCEVIVLA